ncbi:MULTISPECIES: methyltransferase domain-containing protein [Cryobacterium]|uniref:methyltransferase domain-containing protein n=1 Tax=Cryobacterium TaxID=69578 RepID=UPI001356A21E|nr:MULTISPECIES: methyltransferase domain-containing protein [Cryobacterium]
MNKRGFVSLAGQARRLIGDSIAMVDARDLFLGTGWYDPLRDRIADRVAAEHPGRLLDIGCGTGYYLRGILDRVPGIRVLGMDLSPSAVGRTVAGQSGVDGLVADVWSPLPVRDGAADVLLNVFAPRNPPEFHRILTDDGLLAVVVPQERHLRELRQAGLALDVPSNKVAHLVETLAPFFRLEAAEDLCSTLSLEPIQIAALIGMGPSAHHTDAGALTDQLSAVQTVTAAFHLLSFRRLAYPSR